MVDGKHNTDFLARYSGSGLTIAAGGGSIGNDVQATGGGAAGMAFHRPMAYAVNFGLDTDNQLKVGGWSMGNVSHRVLHEGIMMGISFPTPYEPGQRFFRTDRGILYYRNGGTSQWYSVQEYSMQMAFSVFSGTELRMVAPIRNTYAVRVTSISTMNTVINTNNTSNWWDIYHHFYNTGVTARTTLHSLTSYYHSANYWYHATGAPNISSLPTYYACWIVECQKFGNPGNLTLVAEIKYRLIG